MGRGKEREGEREGVHFSGTFEKGLPTERDTLTFSDLRALPIANTAKSMQ